MINPLNQIFPHTLAEVASWGLKQDPMFAPGTRYGYSNTNYIIAGMLIEKVTGRSYGDEVTDRMIKPLGLTGTYLPKPGDHALHAPHVRGYVGQGLLVDFTEIIEPSMGLSGGGLVSTGADATRFIQALITGKVLPQALLNEMRKPNNLPGTAPGYGLGVDVFPLPCGGQAWGHYGIWPGYQTIVAATEDGRSAFVGMNVLQLAPGGSASFSGGGEVIGRNQTMVTALCDR